MERWRLQHTECSVSLCEDPIPISWPVPLSGKYFLLYRILVNVVHKTNPSFFHLFGNLHRSIALIYLFIYLIKHILQAQLHLLIINIATMKFTLVCFCLNQIWKYTIQFYYTFCYNKILDDFVWSKHIMAFCQAAAVILK